VITQVKGVTFTGKGTEMGMKNVPWHAEVRWPFLELEPLVPNRYQGATVAPSTLNREP